MAGHTGAAAEYVAADQYAAVLTTGCVRLDLVLYPGELGTELGYDLYVKDRPDGKSGSVTIACR